MKQNSQSVSPLSILVPRSLVPYHRTNDTPQYSLVRSCKGTKEQRPKGSNLMEWNKIPGCVGTLLKVKYYESARNVLCSFKSAFHQNPFFSFKSNAQETITFIVYGLIVRQQQI